MSVPVYTQNAKGRSAYLPEEMMLVRFLPDGTIKQQCLTQGCHYVKTALDEVTLFIRKGKCIPVAEPAECVDKIDMEKIVMAGYENAEYLLYNDDGITKEYDLQTSIITIRKGALHVMPELTEIQAMILSEK